MSAASHDTRTYVFICKNAKNTVNVIKKWLLGKIYLWRRKYGKGRGRFEVAVVSSTIGIIRVRAALFINYIILHTFVKNCNLYVLRLVMHQRICIFPAETLLVLMMLDQNLSSKFVSTFNALF